MDIIQKKNIYQAINSNAADRDKLENEKIPLKLTRCPPSKNHFKPAGIK